MKAYKSDSVKVTYIILIYLFIKSINTQEINFSYINIPYKSTYLDISLCKSASTITSIGFICNNLILVYKISIFTDLIKGKLSTKDIIFKYNNDFYYEYSSIDNDNFPIDINSDENDLIIITKRYFYLFAKVPFSKYKKIPFPYFNKGYYLINGHILNCLITFQIGNNTKGKFFFVFSYKAFDENDDSFIYNFLPNVFPLDSSFNSFEILNFTIGKCSLMIIDSIENQQICIYLSNTHINLKDLEENSISNDYSYIYLFRINNDYINLTYIDIQLIEKIKLPYSCGYKLILKEYFSLIGCPLYNNSGGVLLLNPSKRHSFYINKYIQPEDNILQLSDILDNMNIINKSVLFKGKHFGSDINLFSYSENTTKEYFYCVINEIYSRVLYIIPIFISRIVNNNTIKVLKKEFKYLVYNSNMSSPINYIKPSSSYSYIQSLSEGKIYHDFYFLFYNTYSNNTLVFNLCQRNYFLIKAPNQNFTNTNIFNSTCEECPLSYESKGIDMSYCSFCINSNDITEGICNNFCTKKYIQFNNLVESSLNSSNYFNITLNQYGVDCSGCKEYLYKAAYINENSFLMINSSPKCGIECSDKNKVYIDNFCYSKLKYTNNNKLYYDNLPSYLSSSATSNCYLYSSCYECTFHIEDGCSWCESDKICIENEISEFCRFNKNTTFYQKNNVGITYQVKNNFQYQSQCYDKYPIFISYEEDFCGSEIIINENENLYEVTYERENNKNSTVNNKHYINKDSYILIFPKDVFKDVFSMRNIYHKKYFCQYKIILSYKKRIAFLINQINEYQIEYLILYNTLDDYKIDIVNDNLKKNKEFSIDSDFVIIYFTAKGDRIFQSELLFNIKIDISEIPTGISTVQIIIITSVIGGIILIVIILLVIYLYNQRKNKKINIQKRIDHLNDKVNRIKNYIISDNSKNDDPNQIKNINSDDIIPKVKGGEERIKNREFFKIKIKSEINQNNQKYKEIEMNNNSLLNTKSNYCINNKEKQFDTKMIKDLPENKLKSSDINILHLNLSSKEAGLIKESEIKLYIKDIFTNRKQKKSFYHSLFNTKLIKLKENQEFSNCECIFCNNSLGLMEFVILSCRHFCHYTCFQMNVFLNENFLCIVCDELIFNKNDIDDFNLNYK